MNTDSEMPKGGSLPRVTIILLVEDEAPVRKMTALVLRRLGYGVQEASSGEEALRLAQASQEKIELLMTDVLMPGMSGRELRPCPGSRGRGAHRNGLPAKTFHGQCRF
ncbi:MAG: response regulator [Verrucomicrobia bacterium]|nr:response regulator [Verrucomicrobiota bacterium]